MTTSGMATPTTSAETSTSDASSGEQVTKEEFDNAMAGLRKSLQDKHAKQRAADIQAARTAEREEMLADLDAGDADELKARVAKLRESESETAKLKRALDRAHAERDEATAQLTSLATRQRDADIDAAIIAAAGVGSYADSVLAHMRLAGRSGGLEVDESGKVTAHGIPIEKAVNKLLTDNPHLVRGDQDRGGGGSNEPVTEGVAIVSDPRSFETKQKVAADRGMPSLYGFERKG